MPDKNAIIHIVDDDEAALDSLSFLLASADLPVATHQSAKAFLASLSTATVGALITDVRMPDMSGIELLREVRGRLLTFPVIVITGHADIPLAVSAMQHGATDFLEKPFDDTAALSAVRSALSNQAEQQRSDGQRAEIQDRLRMLSVRERQVLHGLIAGNPNKTIAYDLGISPRTVEIYRANLMTKMNAATLSDLVRMSILAGAFDHDPKR